MPSIRAVLGITAVLASLLPASLLPAQSEAPLGERIELALNRARSALRHHLGHSDGGELALLCLAAVDDGVSTKDRWFRSYLERLQRAELGGSYALSLRLMVMARVQDFPKREQTAAADAAFLLEHQAADGGFTYGPRAASSDLSNTQYAALGLRAAAHLGVEVPVEAWRRMGDLLLNVRQYKGGFSYRGDGATTASMTVAGIAVLELCRQHLSLDEREDKRYRRAIDDAWGWMRSHKSRWFELNRSHALYVFYGLERAAVLSGYDLIDRVDWFTKGAEKLLELQRPGGGFVNAKTASKADRNSKWGRSIDTAFAVLFLRRDFQARLSGPITPGPSRGCRELAEDADEQQIRATVAYEVARGERAVPDLLDAMRRGHEPARRAAALAMIEITGDDFGYHPARDAEANAEALHRAERWWTDRDED